MVNKNTEIAGGESRECKEFANRGKLVGITNCKMRLTRMLK